MINKSKEEFIRKNVDIPKSLLKKLQIAAIYDNRRVKNYLEKVIIDHLNKIKLPK